MEDGRLLGFGASGGSEACGAGLGVEFVQFAVGAEEQQLYVDGGAHTQLALEPDAPAVGLHYLLAYGQAQAQAALELVGVVLRLEEALENVTDLRGGDAAAVIGDAYGHRVALQVT